jgi:hypothetical protein
MPNHVTSKLTITGPKADQTALIKLMKGEESDFDFNKVVTMPDELDGIQTGGCTINGKKVSAWREKNGSNFAVKESELKSLMKKFGAVNWYDWNNNNWGTKWNCYGVQEVVIKKNSTIYEFDTAWDSPRTLLSTLSAKFPKLTFKVKCSGEIDHPYSYEVKNGDIQ